jgi:hypothetical protein
MVWSARNDMASTEEEPIIMGDKTPATPKPKKPKKPVV